MTIFGVTIFGDLGFRVFGLFKHVVFQIKNEKKHIFIFNVTQ